MFIVLACSRFSTIQFYAVSQDFLFPFIWFGFIYLAFFPITIHFLEWCFATGEFILCIFLNILWKHFQRLQVALWGTLEPAWASNFHLPYCCDHHSHFRVYFYSHQASLPNQRYDSREVTFRLVHIWLIITFLQSYDQFHRWNFIGLFWLFSHFCPLCPWGFSCTLKSDRLMLFQLLLSLPAVLPIDLGEYCSRLLFTSVWKSLLKASFDCWNLCKKHCQPTYWACKLMRKKLLCRIFQVRDFPIEPVNRVIFCLLINFP